MARIKLTSITFTSLEIFSQYFETQNFVPTFDVTYRILDHVDVTGVTFRILAKFLPFASAKTDALGIYGRLAIQGR